MQLKGFWRIPGELLLCPDHRGRTDIPAYSWIHWHHPQEGKLSETECELTHQVLHPPSINCFLCSSVFPTETEQGPLWPGGRWRSHHAGGVRFPQEVSNIHGLCCLLYRTFTRSALLVPSKFKSIMHVIRFLPAQHRTLRRSVISFKTALWMLEYHKHGSCLFECFRGHYILLKMPQVKINTLSNLP